MKWATHHKTPMFFSSTQCTPPPSVVEIHLVGYSGEHSLEFQAADQYTAELIIPDNSDNDVGGGLWNGPIWLMLKRYSTTVPLI